MNRRLAEAHRLAQARLGAQTVLRLRDIWPLLDNNNVDGSFRRWLDAATPIIRAQRMTSARIAANYLAADKAATLGVTAPRLQPVLAERLDRRALSTSLLVTGPLSLKRAAARGVPARRANDVALAASAAAAMRHALDGGRETIVQTLQADRNAVAYERVASSSACNFCEDLAGVRFKDAEVFQAHDGCACTAAPVWG